MKRPPLGRVLAVCLLFVPLACSTVGGGGRAPAGTVPVGVATVDITPEEPIRLTGYGDRREPADRVEQRLVAQAIAFGGDRSPSVLISVEVVGIPMQLTERLARRLERAGVRREQLVVTATHTHNGPALSGVLPSIFPEPVPPEQQAAIDRYTERLAVRLEEAALAAIADRSPARLAWGVGRAGFAINRRVLRDGRWTGFGETPGGPVDHALPVLRVTAPDGSLRAVVLGYATHCTTLTGRENFVHGDWAGAARELIARRHPGAVAMVLIGTGADSNPTPRGGGLPHVERHAREVADEVDRLLSTALRPLDAAPEGRFRTVDLAFQRVPTRAELAERAARSGAEGVHARLLLARLDRGEPIPDRTPYPVQSWTFGDDLAMVFLGGEVVVDYGLRLKRELDASRLWVTAYANDVSFYVASRRLMGEGGYEVDGSMVYYGQPSRLAVGAEETVVRAVHELIPDPFRAPARSGGVQPAPVAAAPVADANQRLDRLAEAYYEERLPLSPTTATSIGDDRYNHLYVASFAEGTRERTRALNERYLAALRAIDPSGLDEQHRLTYDVFLFELESSLRAHAFPAHLQPLNQFYNFGSSFAQLGSGTGLHPFKRVRDYDDFLSRIGGFQAAVDTAIANMRRGVAAGVVQPRIVIEKALPQIAAHIVDDPRQSLFFQPIARMPDSIPAAERERLTAAYLRAIQEQVVPAYRKLHAFVRDEYLPRTRSTVGLSALPGGQAWYEHLARTNTTTSLTPDQIHEIGLAEVARVHGEMEKVKAQLGFQGTLRQFFQHLQTDPKNRYTSREEMLREYRGAKARIDATTDRLFDIRPAADYEIRPVEPFRERSAAAASYQDASPDGTRPGIFYLNTFDAEKRPRDMMETIILHEGSPGHHFQSAIQRELQSLPRIRRFAGFTAYSEGWGLYAETLGRELGVYTDPYQYYGSLSAELWRAIRLVLDTGIHARGWTREQAIEYFLENSSQPETNVVIEVERFIAIPGQALAYKIGQLKISELRRRAEAELGTRFDVKAFHREVLEDGALPLEVLEAKIDRWIAARKG